MIESEFQKHLKNRGLSQKDIDFSVTAVKKFERYLKENSSHLDTANKDEIKGYVSYLIESGSNSFARLVALARYFGFSRKNDCFIYLVSLFGARNVLPDIGERLVKIAGNEKRNIVFEGFELPPLGAPQEAYPSLTKRIMDRMETELPLETCKKVLTWNYHRVPIEIFKEKKERFQRATNIDTYLKKEHGKLMEELERCMKEDRLWYEQEITPEVLQFVKTNQEICTGIRHGDRIYVTKMPFAPKQYLKEKDPKMKRYYACHCQLVRTTIRDGEPEISRNFCYCSAGYEKLRFDAIFGEPVEVEILESALDGNDRCRFANKIPKNKMN